MYIQTSIIRNCVKTYPIKFQPFKFESKKEFCVGDFQLLTLKTDKFAFDGSPQTFERIKWQSIFWDSSVHTSGFRPFENNCQNLRQISTFLKHLQVKKLLNSNSGSNMKTYPLKFCQYWLFEFSKFRLCWRSLQSGIRK